MLDITKLADLVAADAERNVGTGPTWAALSMPTSRELHRATRWLEGSHPDVYGLFGSENELSVAMVEALDSSEKPADLEALAEALRAHAQTRWISVAPIVNIMPPPQAELLAPGTVLVGTPVGERPNMREIRASLQALLGHDDIDPGRRHDYRPERGLLDTRHTASLIVSDTGTQHACEQRARHKAQFALAVWTLLKPPHDEVHMSLWPVVTEWLPQPAIHVTPASRCLDPDVSQPRGASVYYEPDEHALYQPPGGPLRAAPFRALGNIHTHPATALLSASWSLYLAAKLPFELQWLDRLMLIVRARDALCEPPPSDAAGGDAPQRWQALFDRLELVRELRRRGFTQGDIKSVTGRAWQLRNLAAHSAEMALLTLGYPPTRTRPVRGEVALSGAELAPLHIRETVEPIFAAVSVAATRLWEEMLACGFDEAVWEKLLAP